MFDDHFKKRYKTIPFAYVSNDYEKEDNRLHGNRIFHHHKEFEILIIRKGRAELRIEGESEALPLSEGDVVLIPPLLPHCYSKEVLAPFSHDCVCFDLSLLADRALAEGLENGTLRPPAVLSGEAASKVYALVRAAVDACREGGKGWELETVARLSLVFSYLLREGKIEASTLTARDGFCARVSEILSQYYTEAISSSFVAAKLYMSHAYFCRRFRAAFGLRFMEYLAMYRVEKSKALLRDGTLPISEIALAVGFHSFSHFTKTFKAYACNTPSVYRARRGV